MNFALGAISNVFGKLPSVTRPIPTPADGPIQLHEVDLPRNLVKAALYHRFGPLVLNVEGGNRSALASDHRANSALKRAWNALMKWQTA